MRKMKRPPSEFLAALASEPLMIEPGAWSRICAAGGFDFFAAPSSDPPTSAASVAVIQISGYLVAKGPAWLRYYGAASYEWIGEMLDEAMTDSGIEAVVLDIHSPGGQVAGAFGLGDKIAAAAKEKPIIALANEHMHSSAYALAAGAGKILVASKTASLGSIGIIGTHLDTSEAEKKIGLRFTEIFSGRKKNLFTSHKPLSDEAREDMQKQVDELYGVFVTHVAKMRGISEDDVRAQESGVFMGVSAIANGLADAMGGLDEAMAMAMGLAEKKRGKAQKSSGPSAAASAPAISAKEEEVIMDPTKADAGNIPGATVIDMEKVTAEAVASGRAQALADAQEIVALCTLAGEPDKANAFIAEGKSVPDVRKELLATKAAASAAGEVSGARANLAPEAQAKEAGILVENMDKRLKVAAVAARGV